MLWQQCSSNLVDRAPPQAGSSRREIARRPWTARASRFRDLSIEDDIPPTESGKHLYSVSKIVQAT